MRKSPGTRSLAHELRTHSLQAVTGPVNTSTPLHTTPARVAADTPWHMATPARPAWTVRQTGGRFAGGRCKTRKTRGGPRSRPQHVPAGWAPRLRAGAVGNLLAAGNPRAQTCNDGVWGAQRWDFVAVDLAQNSGGAGRHTEGRRDGPAMWYGGGWPCSHPQPTRTAHRPPSTCRGGESSSRHFTVAGCGASIVIAKVCVCVRTCMCIHALHADATRTTNRKATQSREHSGDMAGKGLQLRSAPCYPGNSWLPGGAHRTGEVVGGQPDVPSPTPLHVPSFRSGASELTERHEHEASSGLKPLNPFDVCRCTDQ